MRRNLLALSLALPLLVALIAGLTTRSSAASRTWGVATSVEDAGHVGLAHYYEALTATSSAGVARALHYGDSTIVADGIARTVRSRLATRFGDAGPGFVSAAFDPSWNRRTDALGQRTGSWTLKTILFGGAGGRYGLGGIVGIARNGAAITARAVDSAGASRVMHHLEVWYQRGQGYGEAAVSVDGRELVRQSAVAAETADDRFVADVTEGYSTARFGAATGTVPFYGVVMETGGPGITWESLGVLGVGSRSFTAYAGEGLAPQVALRAPDLLVVMLGGNEAGYPALLANGGAPYAPIFAGALQTIRAGAPNASCLVLSPLDQGYFEEVPEVADASVAGSAAPLASAAPVAPIVPTGPPRSRPGMPNLVAQQRAVAKAAGCAFWSTYDAMGGRGSALVWGAAGGMGTGDYVHVTARAQEILGNLLSDALLGDYDQWKAGR